MIKAEDLDLGQGIVRGYGSVFGNVDSDGDVMVKGCYKKTLSENKERMKFLWQHNMQQPLGKFSEMEEDDYGLKFEAKISNTQLGEDAKQLISDGVLDEFSVGFLPIKYETIKNDKGDFVGYEMKEVKLFEISLVTFAANDQARLEEYKSEFSHEDMIAKFDAIIKLNNHIKSDEARLVMEYELRKFKEILEAHELSLNKHKEDEQKVKENIELLNDFNKLINNF